MKIRKSVVVSLLLFLGVIVLVRYALRDIRLDVDLLREGLERMPTIVLENLEFEREISGDFWQVRIPMAERHKGVTEVFSVDIRRWLPDGKEWYFRGDSGIYREEEGEAKVFRLLGTLEMDSRVLNLESPLLSWEQNTNVFLFPKGFTIYDSEFILTADLASIDEDGVILLDRGGTVRWTKNAD